MRREAPGVTLIAHLHDTRGTGLVNALAAYEAGVRYFDCSFGGVGGHPAQVQVRRRLHRQRLHRGSGEPVRVARHLAPASTSPALLETADVLRADARPRAARPRHAQRAQSAVTARELIAWSVHRLVLPSLFQRERCFGSPPPAKRWGGVGGGGRPVTTRKAPHPGAHFVSRRPSPPLRGGRVKEAPPRHPSCEDWRVEEMDSGLALTRAPE